MNVRTGNRPTKESTQSTEGFDPTPAAAETWIAELPILNPGETTRRVYSALLELNKQDLDPGQRMTVLDMLRGPVIEVLPALEKHFIGKRFPLGEKARMIAELSRSLLTEMALGYRLVVADAARGSERRARNRLLTNGTYWALTYLRLALVKAYLVYAPYPAGLWRVIHALYAAADQAGVADSPVSDARTGDAGTIEASFIQLILLTLACPYRLRQSEIVLTHAALAEWAPLCELRTPEQWDEDADTNGVFIVDLTSDDPPAYLGLHRDVLQGNPYRLLDTTRLGEHLREELSRLRSAARPERLQSGLGPTSLRRLMLSWGVAPRRRFSRSEGHSSATVAMGLSAIHHFISGEIVFSSGERWKLDPSAPVKDAPAFGVPASFGTAGEVPATGHEPDIWEMGGTRATRGDGDTQGPAVIEFEPVSPSGVPAAKKASPPVRLYETQEWKMVNVSAGGYCLLWDSQRCAQAQVGELVGIREATDPDTFHLGIGIIRWMKSSRRKGLQLGVQMLSPGAVAIAIRPVDETGANGDYLRALLLPEIRALRQPATLIIPALPGQLGATLIVSQHGRESRVRLTKLVENTGCVAQFEFTPLEAGDDDTDVENRPDIRLFDPVWRAI